MEVFVFNILQQLDIVWHAFIFPLLINRIAKG
jgi:hypothetical protein